jgi:hypothetical protein
MRRVSTVFLALLLIAGCASPGASPSSPAGFSLRAWVSQAIEPVAGFAMGGSWLAISDGRLIVSGPTAAIFPSPILPNFQQRSIGPNGIGAIVAAADAAGLLGDRTDFTGGSMPGAQTGHLRFVVDGIEREVVGNVNSQIVCITTPCAAAPGTPEAFGGFWSLLSNLESWVPGELGTQTPYDPERLAILLTQPTIDPTLPGASAAWPLGGPMSKFGVVFSSPQGLPPVRCGVVEGEDLAAALVAFRNGNGLTRWTDTEGDERGVVVRALVPGDPDPCLPGAQG